VDTYGTKNSRTFKPNIHLTKKKSTAEITLLGKKEFHPSPEEKALQSGKRKKAVTVRERGT